MVDKRYAMRSTSSYRPAVNRIGNGVVGQATTSEDAVAGGCGTDPRRGRYGRVVQGVDSVRLRRPPPHTGLFGRFLETNLAAYRPDRGCQCARRHARSHGRSSSARRPREGTRDVRTNARMDRVYALRSARRERLFQLRPSGRSADGKLGVHAPRGSRSPRASSLARSVAALSNSAETARERHYAVRGRFDPSGVSKCSR